MVISELTKVSEIRYCVDMYLALNDATFMPADPAEALKNLSLHVRLKRFVRCLKDDNRIIAWIYCREVKLEHTNFPNFQQMYFATDQSGVKAFRSISKLHEAMYEHSKHTAAAYCISPGSHMDPDFTFVRILEKLGWMRRGYIAVRPVLRS